MELATTRAEFCRVILPLQPNLTRVALRLTRNGAEASDLVQDAFERALREWTRFTPGTNARAWMNAILSRLFIDGWRRRRRRAPLVPLDEVELPSNTRAADETPATTPWDSITDADLERAVAALPASLRDVFRMNAFDRLSYGEIGAALGIPVNTVGTRIMRARRRLRLALQAQVSTPAMSFRVPEPVPHTCARAAVAPGAPPRSAEPSIGTPAWMAHGGVLASRPV